jgi:hypothetical protein
MPETVDVERELERLRARVRGLNAPPPTPEMTPLQKAVSGVNANWHITARLPAPANAPLQWRAVYFVKKVARRVMLELLNTVVQQQNSFNVQVAQAVTELAKSQARIAELERRIAELEGQVHPGGEGAASSDRAGENR